MYINLIYYYHNYNLKTIEKIINRWTETNVKNYINFVAKYMKINEKEIFNLNKENLIKLAKAIVLFENGVNIDEEVFEVAYLLLPKEKKILIEKNN